MPTSDVLLDEILGGGILKPSIIVLGGQSGTGKTTFAAKLLNHLSVEPKYKSAFFSLEMSISEVGVMTVCHNKKVTRASFCNQENGFYDNALNKIESNQCLTISANKSLSIEDIFLEARYIKAKQGLDVVFIDFLTALRVSAKVGSEYEKINYIMGEIGRLAADLNVAVILLTQVNRELANSKDGKPAMNHLKGSSSIENFADYVLFTHRDSIANPDCGHDYLELLIRKNRYGKNGSVFYESKEGTIFDVNQVMAKDTTSMQKDVMFKPAISL
jgi:replicative DNA helicase